MEIRPLILLKQKSESNRSCEQHLGSHRNTINHYVRLFRASEYDYEHFFKPDRKGVIRAIPFATPLYQRTTPDQINNYF